MSESLLGRQLDEYRLDELLGKGGMARVYRGTDLRLHRHVAIKVIDTPFRNDADYVKRFELEAQAIGQLQHPHIVSLYRFGEVENVMYMAMQYVQGVDLAYVLRSYQADGEYIEPEEALRILREICSALDYAHQKGIIHRDVKPSNIMLAQDGTAILTDFGLALLTDVGTRGEIFGSPHYIAPEQAVSSANVVPQTDLYAMGVILFEMFTGVLPFDAEDSMDIAMKHMSEPPPMPTNIRPNLSMGVEQVIMRALAKKPQDRYQTGAELADALGKALIEADKPTFSPPSTLERKSIVDRVQLELDAHPLPPLPAAVSTPAFAPTQARPNPTPPQATAAMATQQSAVPQITQLNVAQQVTQPNVAQHATGQYAVPAATGQYSVSPANTTQTILTAKRTSPMLYMGVGGMVVVVLGIIGLILLLASNNDDDNNANDNTQVAQATTAVPEVVPMTFTPDVPLTAQVFPTTQTLPTLTPLIIPSNVAPTANIPTATPAPTLTTVSATRTRVPRTRVAPTNPPPNVEGYQLQTWRYDEKAVFIKNVGTSPIPLLLVEFKDKKDETNFSGERFELPILNPGECARVWDENELPESGAARTKAEESALNKLSLTCDLVGNAPRIRKENVFWEDAFVLYYNANEIDTCANNKVQCDFKFGAQ